MRASVDWFTVYDGNGNDADALGGNIRRELSRHSVVRVVNTVPSEDPLKYWMRVGTSLGRSVETVEDGDTGEPRLGNGAWMDVRFEPGRHDTFRYHNTGQPLHTDGAYDSESGDLALFYMARQAVGGGSSLFVDAATVAAIAQQEDRALFEALTTVPIRFGKPGNIGRIVPILRYSGQSIRINWNYYRVLPDQGEQIAWLRERFRVFLEHLVESGRVTEFMLCDGDAVLFKDEEVLHGRQAYAAESSGDRLLWKTYFMTSEPNA